MGMSGGPRGAGASEDGAAEVLVDGRVSFAVAPSEHPARSAIPTTAAAAPRTSRIAVLPRPPHRNVPGHYAGQRLTASPGGGTCGCTSGASHVPVAHGCVQLLLQHR